MESQTQPFYGRLRLRDRCLSLVSAAMLAALGVVAGFTSFIFAEPIYSLVAAEWAGLGEFLRSYAVQPGMGVVALGYVWWSDDYNPLDRVRMPSSKESGWIAVGIIGNEIGIRALTPLLSLIGITHGGHSGEIPRWRVFVDQPELIVPGLVIMFVIMAPMEELLYRGVVHETLTGAIGSRGRVVVSGLLFGGIHLFLSAGVVSMITTTMFGFILGASYERTSNLTVPIMIHAGYWMLI